MFGPKLRNVFKSRWHALAWSASILLTAYCTVPHPGDGPDADAANEAKAMAALLNDGAQGQKPARHVNPWAKTDQAAK